MEGHLIGREEFFECAYVFSKTMKKKRKISSPKDYRVFKCTGAYLIDYSAI